MKCYANTDEVKKAMFLTGITFSQIARKTGLSTATVTKAIHGKEIGVATCHKVAEVLGKPVEELFRYE